MLNIIMEKLDENMNWKQLTRKEYKKFVNEHLDELWKEIGIHALIKITNKK